ncbi:hypothetical protein A3Q56_03268 [Intoshia linei]|uniref:Uncharacterized protein n=1 Tax=Intoshia linei TaxID=1819745 RepID=A0A177B3V4_9BILA|nr:hypothetical protein A3Q56_03268 [Intoshia linei]
MQILNIQKDTSNVITLIAAYHDVYTFWNTGLDALINKEEIIELLQLWKKR